MKLSEFLSNSNYKLSIAEKSILEVLLKDEPGPDKINSLVEKGLSNMLKQDNQRITKSGKNQAPNINSYQHKLHKELVDKAAKRVREKKYVWLTGSTENQRAKSFLYCPYHKEIHDMDLIGLSGGSEQRPRNPHGLRCCSEQHHLQVTTQANKMRAKSQEQRILERKQKREVVKSRVQQLSAKNKEKVFSQWGHCCALTGSKKNLEIHHLYSESTYPELGNILSNCVVLTAFVHQKFHNNLYDPLTRSYLPATPQNFIDYLKGQYLLHKNCIKEIQANKRPPLGLEWHQTLVNNIEVLLPKIIEANNLLKKVN